MQFSVFYQIIYTIIGCANKQISVTVNGIIVEILHFHLFYFFLHFKIVCKNSTDAVSTKMQSTFIKKFPRKLHTTNTTTY